MNNMTNILKIVSLFGLLLTVVPSFMVFYKVIDKPIHFMFMLIGAVLWFGTAPFWMKGTSLE